MRIKDKNKMRLWTFRVEPSLLVILKRKGRKAAPWVRSLIWKALNK